MKALITGSKGQLGFELARCVPPGVEAIWTDRDQLDISDPDMTDQVLNDIRPDLIINAAAYTAVDRAESEPDQAEKINHIGAMNLAVAAHRLSARMLHLSTDYVFSGQGRPYQVDDPVNPLSVYAATKARGEAAIRTNCPAALIVRTAWVYSIHGDNFVKTMLRLMAERPSLNVVCDQLGSPTWAKGLAQTIWKLSTSTNMPDGIIHYTDSGVASWYDWAVAIQEEALLLGLLPEAIPIHPIPASAFPTVAKRPGFCVLDKASILPFAPISVHWRVHLRSMLTELKTTA